MNDCGDDVGRFTDYLKDTDEALFCYSTEKYWNFINNRAFWQPEMWYRYG